MRTKLALIAGFCLFDAGPVGHRLPYGSRYIWGDLSYPGGATPLTGTNIPLQN